MNEVGTIIVMLAIAGGVGAILYPAWRAGGSERLRDSLPYAALVAGGGLLIAVSPSTP